MIVAFVVSLIVIKFLMGYIKKHNFIVFGWYRIVLGAIVLLCGIAGHNPAYVIQGMKLIGLALSNAIVALSGGLLSQYSGFSDVNMGRGGIVIGLAAVIIGEVLGDAILGKHMNFMGKLIFVIFGGIVYYIVIGIVLWLQMPSDDLKLFTAIIVAIFLAVPYLKGKSKASFKKAGKRSATALNAKEGK